LRIGDVGTQLTFTILDEDGDAVDLTDADKVYVVLKLGNTRVERECNIIAPATDGKVYYNISDDDPCYDKAGMMRMQVRVEFVGGNIFSTSRVEEEIERVL